MAFLIDKNAFSDKFGTLHIKRAQIPLPVHYPAHRE
jgi:hypothetical protein